MFSRTERYNKFDVGVGQMEIIAGLDGQRYREWCCYRTADA
jgi:hypothetical protein